MVDNPRGPGQIQADVILWDIMGTSTLRELLKEAYYHGAQGILAVADLTRQDTLGALDEWARPIRSVAGGIPAFGGVNQTGLAGEGAIPAAGGEAFFPKGAWAWAGSGAEAGRCVREAVIGPGRPVVAVR